MHNAALLHVGSAILTSPCPRVSLNFGWSTIEITASGLKGKLELIALSSHLNDTNLSELARTQDNKESK
jgi:hypothetical protein